MPKVAVAIYATLVILVVSGILLFSAVCHVERWVLPWHVSMRGQQESLWQA